jgi:Family of unknown function (DUF6789)
MNEKEELTMTIFWGNAIIAGLAGTAAMTILMYMAKAMGMPMDMPRMLGLMFTRPENKAGTYMVGLVAHFMNGVIFAIIYAFLFTVLGHAGWIWGLVFGAVHSVFAGIVLGMMPLVHPRVGPGKELPSPGIFAKNISSMAPMGLIMLHLVYGAIVGAIYAM